MQESLIMGSQWVIPNSNFNDIFNSLINNLKMIIGDNWMISMILAIDHVGYGM
jgi:hypothetical protein